MEEKSKRKRLLSSAYTLFKTKGLNKTTIQDIVDAAKVAKGTFYLYFEDKYHIQEELIIEKSKEIFNIALNELYKQNINNFDDQIIFIVDYIVDYIQKEPEILNFISKDLSLGLYQDKLNKLFEDNDLKIYDLFVKGIKENNINIKRPEITLFMIIEFVSATCFSIITKKVDLSVDDYKPYLHSVIRHLINNE